MCPIFKHVVVLNVQMCKLHAPKSFLIEGKPEHKVYIICTRTWVHNILIKFIYERDVLIEIFFQVPSILYIIIMHGPSGKV